MRLDVQARIAVLDHGHVELIDHMGNDDRIIEAAHVCTGCEAYPKDAGAFIAKLWQAGHTSPFEQVVLTYRIRCPIFVARQIMRHRTARLNEISMRYTTAEDGDGLEFYIPPDERLGDHPDTARGYVERLYMEARNAYKTMLVTHVVPEVARCVLPLATYTQFIWQMDLRNLLHFLVLRLAKGAQYETQRYAEAIKELAEGVAPLAVAAAL